MRLSEHFTFEELTATQQRGYDNKPPPEALPALTATAQGLERIRTLLDHPIHVLSGYRSPALNLAVGGRPSSQHCDGEAADWICPGYGTPRKIATFLAGQMTALAIDQLILEYDRWVHCSFTTHPRYIALTIDAKGTHGGIV
jgi:hypothetical protein